MKRVHWSWFLPFVQLALALACHVYDPHEYRVRAHRDGAVDNMEYAFQHSPALSGRLSQGINFPAMVLDYPFRNESDAIYERNSAYTLIWIAPKDIGFFVGIVLFWHWVGRKLDERQGRSSRDTWPRKVRIAGLACGVVFGILTGAYADHLIASNWLPQRQIGTFGIAWASALIAYFTWRLTREFSLGRNAKRSFLVLSVPMFIVAVLWIGGPIGATQALGEYLRPTAVKRMPVSGECTANEIPSPNVMRIVESHRKLYHLSLQTVIVCRSVTFGGFSQDDPRFAAITLDGIAYRSWRPLEAGRSYQYRRHFAVVVADGSENDTVVVEAALIQSRWDYLRLNWNKVLNSFFWPYPRSQKN